MIPRHMCLPHRPGFKMMDGESRRDRIDLSRRKDEKDKEYRGRILEVVGSLDGFARDAAHRVAGKCLERFAGSVSHAQFIGWHGATGKPRDEHLEGCTCPIVVRNGILSARETIEECRLTIEKMMARKAAAELELARLMGLPKSEE